MVQSEPQGETTCRCADAVLIMLEMQHTHPCTTVVFSHSHTQTSILHGYFLSLALLHTLFFPLSLPQRHSDSALKYFTHTWLAKVLLLNTSKRAVAKGTERLFKKILLLMTVKTSKLLWWWIYSEQCRVGELCNGTSAELWESPLWGWTLLWSIELLLKLHPFFFGFAKSTELLNVK